MQVRNAKKLTEDINEMEKMLNEYLQFTSSSYAEKDEMFNLSELISEVVEKYNNENISLNLTPRIYFNGRKNSFPRSNAWEHCSFYNAHILRCTYSCCEKISKCRHGSFAVYSWCLCINSWLSNVWKN